LTWEICKRFGFDANAIARRVQLVGLAGKNNLGMGLKMQRLVIVPNATAITEGILASLSNIDQFEQIVVENSNANRLRKFQNKYLSGLGVNFGSPAYFEERLRIGYVHHEIGVPLSLYQASFRMLEYMLIQHIPTSIRDDRATFDELLEFILKITALDASLAVESYCMTQVCGLEDSLQDERGKTQRLRQLAITDWLTDLHNHAYSRHLLQQELDNSQRDDRPLCVIMADLDQFKKINDEHGHLVGDHVLRIAAARMVAGARTSDEIGRYGGEEFIFVLQDTDLETAGDVAERVRARMNSDAIHHHKAVINVSLSLGIAQARSDDTVDTLIERADATLYAAKLAGRDCVMLERKS
jgi:diguanylate cyclase (GGDEF)-like protein